MPSEHQIRGGLSFSGIGVHISRDQPGRLPGDQFPAVRVLSDSLITCRTVDDHCRPLQRCADAGRDGGPHILADLCRYDQILHCSGLEQDAGSKGDLVPLKGDVSRLIWSRSELPHLIELPVIGKERFCSKADDLSPVQRRRHIVEFALDIQRHAHEHQDILVRSMLRDLKKSLLCRPEKDIVGKEIAAGISGHAQFRKHQDLRPVLTRFADISQNPFRIVLHVRHPDIRGRCRHFDKTMFHCFPAFPSLRRTFSYLYYLFAFLSRSFSSSTEYV